MNTKRNPNNSEWGITEFSEASNTTKNPESHQADGKEICPDCQGFGHYMNPSSILGLEEEVKCSLCAGTGTVRTCSICKTQKPALIKSGNAYFCGSCYFWI